MYEARDSVFQSSYIEHSQAVFCVAAKICGTDYAVDVTQDVFVEFWQNPDRFDPERGTMRAFLVTIAHHKAVDVVRSGVARTARERRLSAVSWAPDRGIDSNLISEEKGSRVTDALRSLPIDRRDAIVTAFYGECTYREAAVALGQPEGTIKSRIRSGLGQLRVLLADEQLLENAACPKDSIRAGSEDTASL
jgi:RNA polymerase sigma-70 factor (ECF subfamily)